MEKALQKQTMGDGWVVEVGKTLLLHIIIVAMIMGAFWLGGFVNSLN